MSEIKQSLATRHREILRLRMWWERRFRKPMQEALKEQIRPVLDSISAQGIDSTVDGLDTIVKPDAVSDAYKNLYIEVGMRFARMEHERKSADTGMELKAEQEVWEDIWRQEMNAFFESEGAAMVTEVTNTSKELVRNKIKDILSQTDVEGVEAVQRTIRRELEKEYFGKTAIYRARRIAQTEVLKASNQAQIMATEQLGYDFTKTWVTGGQSRVERHTTYPGLHGQQRGKDDLFDVGGYQMKQPGDSSHGAPASEIINCKCIVVTDLKI